MRKVFTVIALLMAVLLTSCAQRYDIEEMKILRFTDLGDDLLEEVAAWYSVGDDVMKVIDADNDWYLDGEGIVITGFDVPATLPYIEVEGAIKDRYLPY